MFGSVPIESKRVEDYRSVIGDEPIAELTRLAAPLKGARVVHINATAFGGGVAEILSAMVPLMNDLGLEADWQVIRGSEDFFRVTKAMHNSLQGMYVPWTPDMWATWRENNRRNAELFDEDYDFVVVHDPQPAGLRQYVMEQHGASPKGKWLWRCHIDLTDAQVEAWDFLHPYIEAYHGVIFTLEDYIKGDLAVPNIFTIPPAIDPLSPKNANLPDETVHQVLERYGIDTKRPFICQVSRFDPWKDPLGVIDVYRMVKQKVPDLQLVMVASMAHDDPEGWSYWERTARRAGEDFDIHLLSNLNGVGNVEVNAFQRAADVVIQKSVREGFGLVVSEALWKGRPVVAGNVGGIPLQILEGATGYLVNTVAGCAERVLYLLKHPQQAHAMGAAGREHVRRNFLITRYLRDYLMAFSQLIQGGQREESSVAATGPGDQGG